PAFVIRIQKKKLARVHSGVAKQLESVGLRPAERVFVAKDHPGGIFLEFARSDEAPADAALLRAGHREFLRIRVEGGRGVLAHYIPRDPGLKRGSGARVDV